MRATSGITAGVALVAGVGAADTVQAADWSITARGLILFDNIGERDADYYQGGMTQDYLDDISTNYQEELGDPNAGFTLVDDQFSKDSDQSIFPMGGIAISAPLPGLKNSQVTLAGYYAETFDVQSLHQQQVLNFEANGRMTTDIFSWNITQISEVTRFDLEATFEHRINENVAILWGGRAEHLEQDAEQITFGVNSENYWELFLEETGQDPTSPEDRSVWGYQGGKTVKTTYDVFSFRMGGAAYAKMSDKDTFYVNFLAFVSNEKNTIVETYDDGDAPLLGHEAEREFSEWSVGPDISVGYSRNINDRMAIDLRYRSIVNMRVDSEVYEDPRVAHGITMGLTVWF